MIFRPSTAEDAASLRPPALSLVVAAYNVERELPVLLESLCASGFDDFELCIHDDCSTDGTARVIERFAERLRISASRGEQNVGVTAARNTAAARARSNRLVFLDADVRLYPDTLRRLAEGLDASGADALVGVYSDVALDADVLSRYYALFVHHSFLIADEPIPYNVFNAWCAIIRREAWEAIGGHVVVDKGIEVENETTGRRLNAKGFRLLLDPSIAVDHHWGGHPKLRFIFLQRVYWWVKIFFATGLRFESSLTTRGYGFATLCAPAFLAALAASPWQPALLLPAALLLVGFLIGYGPFYRFSLRRRGLAYTLFAAALSLYFALYAAGSAVFSASEEVLRRLVTGRGSLDPGLFRDEP